jgi:type VII secretion protein EccB
LIGALLAALGFGGAAAYAVISPGGTTAWRNDNAVIVEKETGALYVYREERLQPVLNYTSALLILNSANPATVVVGRSAIAGVPKNAPVGIAGAPATLPPPASLSTGAWSVCSAAERSVLFVGGLSGSAIGRPLGDRAVLATGADGATYLLFRGHKHLIREAASVLIQLSWNTKPKVRIASALVNALPTGVDLRRPTLDRLARFYRVENSYFVAMAGGFAALTPFQYQLMHTGTVTALSLADFDRLGGEKATPFSPDLSDSAGALPAEVPEIVDASGGAVCSGADLRIDVQIPSASAAGDTISVRPGSGAVVSAVAAPGASAGGLSLVTDLGVRHSVPSPDVLAVLGYGGVDPVAVPADVLSLLPEGPALDPVAARTPTAR